MPGPPAASPDPATASPSDDTASGARWRAGPSGRVPRGSARAHLDHPVVDLPAGRLDHHLVTRAATHECLAHGRCVRDPALRRVGLGGPHEMQRGALALDLDLDGRAEM